MTSQTCAQLMISGPECSVEVFLPESTMTICISRDNATNGKIHLGHAGLCAYATKGRLNFQECHLANNVTEPRSGHFWNFQHVPPLLLHAISVTILKNGGPYDGQRGRQRGREGARHRYLSRAPIAIAAAGNKRLHSAKCPECRRHHRMDSFAF